MKPSPVLSGDYRFSLRSSAEYDYHHGLSAGCPRFASSIFLMDYHTANAWYCRLYTVVYRQHLLKYRRRVILPKLTLMHKLLPFIAFVANGCLIENLRRRNGIHCHQSLMDKLEPPVSSCSMINCCALSPSDIGTVASPLNQVDYRWNTIRKVYSKGLIARR